MISEKLIEEQNKIINSTDRRISVLAGPGSGKTYTIIQKVKKDVEFLISDIDKILVLSFTKEAANQLKRKVSEQIIFEEDKIVTTTIDAFLVNLFKWAYFREQNIQKKKIEVTYSKSIDEQHNIYRSEKDPELHRYIRSWERKLHEGNLQLSFVMPIIARRFLKNNDIVTYLSKYRYIYIDEAQDLNKWQFTFFNRLADTIDCNMCYVGDVKQSIYGFRGARPEYFKSLPEFNYKVYEIKESARCPKSILDFSLAYHRNEKINISNFSELHLNETIDKSSFELDKDAMFLCFTRAESLDISEKLKMKGICNVHYVEPYNTSISDEKSYEFNLFLNYIITRITNRKLKNIEIDKRLSLIASELVEINPDFDKEKLLYSNHAYEEINQLILDLYCITISIEEIYSNPINRYFYDKSRNFIRVMTIHASKGLESDNVYLRLSSDFLNNDEETRNKYFVAFTRCKENLYISANNNIIEMIKNIYN